jgi:hypothetical protein
MKNSLPNHIAAALFVHIKIYFYLSTNVGGPLYEICSKYSTYLFAGALGRARVQILRLHYAMRSKIQF